MSSVQVQTALANNGSTSVIMAYVVGVAQLPVTQISIASLTRRIVNLQTGAEIERGTSLNPADVIFNTLQTDYGWTGSVGYNFRDSIVLRANGKNQVSYTMIDTADPPNPIVWDAEITVKAIA